MPRPKLPANSRRSIKANGTLLTPAEAKLIPKGMTPTRWGTMVLRAELARLQADRDAKLASKNAG